MGHSRKVAYLLLRVTVGVVFMFTGLGKLTRGLDGYVASMADRFAGVLPSFYVVPFAFVLPFIETALGLLLAIGLFTRTVLPFAGLVMVAVTYGAVMEPDTGAATYSLLVALSLFILLWHVDHDTYSLDARRRGEPR
ncbi:MAG TPA: DoxX family membrane protein [Longimicrobiales bacterium]|nr:DoxX family membrane protein [Longimicrobiales bacterium]